MQELMQARRISYLAWRSETPICRFDTISIYKSDLIMNYQPRHWFTRYVAGSKGVLSSEKRSPDSWRNKNFVWRKIFSIFSIFIFLHFSFLQKTHRKITKPGSGLVLNHEHTNPRRGQDQKLPSFPRLIFIFADGSSPWNHFRPINQSLALI